MPAMLQAVKLVLLLTVAAAWPGGSHAFSAEGHRVVALIAEAHLCPGAHRWLEPLLEGTDLANAAVWADAIREDPAWAQAKPWHYVGVADREPLGPALRQGGNVLAAITRFERELADPGLPLAQRQVALRFFAHFVADVHQPLHVGRPGDEGGNLVIVHWGKRRLSLHALWDGAALLARERLATRDLAAAIDALATGQVGTWQSSELLDWAEESRAFRPLIYEGLSAHPDGRLTPAQVAAARNVIALRLAQAGVRLAGRLNRIACAPVPSR